MKTVADDWEVAHYVTKATKAGYQPRSEIDDYRAPSRRPFKVGLKIAKYGELGDS